MIKKTLCTLLAFSCYLLSFHSVAEDEVKEEVSPIVSISENTQQEIPAQEISNQDVSNQEISKSLKSSSDVVKQASVADKPQVGKHVMTNMNAGSMILSLLMVLGLIIVCALILKRFNLTQQSASQLKVVTTLRLGTKEQVVVVQVGDKQLLLGVTSQQITLLETLPEPINHQGSETAELPKNILSFLSSKKYLNDKV